MRHQLFGPPRQEDSRSLGVDYSLPTPRRDRIHRPRRPSCPSRNERTPGPECKIPRTFLSVNLTLVLVLRTPVEGHRVTRGPRTVGHPWFPSTPDAPPGPRSDPVPHVHCPFALRAPVPLRVVSPRPLLSVSLGRGGVPGPVATRRDVDSASHLAVFEKKEGR